MEHPASKHLPSLLIIGLALAGCGRSSGVPAARGVRFDTIAGVVHALNEGDGTWGPSPHWHVDTAGTVKIGAVDGPDEYVFGSIGGVVVGKDGRVYVADSQAREIRVFSAQGRFLRRFGRDGQGPGEFANISGLGRGPNGGVAALDGQLGRVSVFDADGGFVRSFHLRRPYMILMNGWPVRFDGDGRFYDRTTLSHGIGTDTVGVVRYGADGDVVDTTLVAIYEPVQALARRNGLVIASFPVPYAANPTSIVGPGGHIYSTSGATYAVARLDPDGDTALVIERDVKATPVTAAERDSALAGLRSVYRKVAGVEPRDLPDIPATQPAISTLRVDEDGYLWVLHPSAPTPDGTTAREPAWDVFESDGRFLGTVTLPAMQVMQISEHAVAGVVHDTMGVPTVEVLPLDRGETPRSG